MSKIVIDHNSDNERLRIGWILDGKHEEFAWFVNRYSQQVIDFTSRMLSNAEDAYGIYSWPETVRGRTEKDLWFKRSIERLVNQNKFRKA
jgi:hypothetical protein